jgi:transcriptional regulator with XRE-family HTH domain
MTRIGGWQPTGFGKILAGKRRAAGLSQAQLAERAGVTPGAISKLERGEHEPAWPFVLHLCRALGVGANDFMPPEPPPKKRKGRKAGAEEQPG